jgi:predicted PurR-regulated permease PerM
MATPTTVQDIQRTTLLVLALVTLLGAALLVLKPFLPSLVWAITIVVATWPLLLGLQARLRGHRGLAVALMTTALLALLLVPIYLAIATIFDNADRITELVATLDTRTLPPPPAWLGTLPFIGPKATQSWQHQTDGGASALMVQLKPYVTQALRALAASAGTFGAVVVQCLLTILITAMLYAKGEAAGLAVRRFARRLAGERGDASVVLAGKAIRSVALGVVVTALAQTMLAGLGLAIAQVPYAGLLTALALILCIAQVGPAPLLIPAVIWLFAMGRPGLGTFLLLWSIIPLTVDNFLRPYFIKRGVDLPLWLIFAGVMGGLLAFGVIGIFLGPVVLAVLYTLMESWVEELGPEPT